MNIASISSRETQLATSDLVTPIPQSMMIVLPSIINKDDVGIADAERTAGPPFVPKSINLFCFVILI